MDQRLPEFVAVVTPARTDLTPVRQSGDTRDKRETIAQSLSLIEDGDIAESNVKQHEAALSITESQISDLQAYLLNITAESIASLSDVVSAANTNRFVLAANGTTGYVGRLLVEADISDLQAYLTSETDPVFLAHDAAAVTAAAIANWNAAFGWGNHASAGYLTSVPDPLLLGDGTNLAPSYSFSGDPDTGIYTGFANVLDVTLGGVRSWTFQAGSLSAQIGNGPQIMREASTSTNPTLVPHVGDPSSGIGGAVGQVSVIAGGVEIARAIEAAGANQFAVVSSGGGGVPDLTGIADPDTGLLWTGANILEVLTAGSTSWSFSSAQFFSSPSDGPAMVNDFGDITKAGFLPQRGDGDTGLGGDGNDTVSLVAGGIAGLRLKEVNSGVVQAPVADVAITAFATGGQGSAVALKQSYNVISVCATAGDSVKLPATFNVNSIVNVKNDGAASCDVFPAIGDNLGQGLNTAEALAAGESAAYIATAANATWTPLIAVGGASVLTDLSDVVSATNTDKFALMANGTTGYVGRALLEADISDLQSYLLSVPTPLIIPSGGNASVPKLAFGDGDTGFYQVVDDWLRIAIAAVDRWTIGSNEFKGIIDGGVMLLDLNATATIPPYTFSNDPDTGIGSAALDQLSFIAGGVEGIRVAEAAAVITNTIFGNLVANGGAGSGPAMLNVGATATVPTFVPNQADPDTGIGRSGVDQLAMIAGGLQAGRFEDPADISARDTALWVYDKDNNQMEQVSVGDADSGGTGFKVLRILN